MLPTLLPGSELSKRCLVYLALPLLAVIGLLLPGEACVPGLMLALAPVPLYQMSCMPPGRARSLFALATALAIVVLLGETAAALVAPSLRPPGVPGVLAFVWMLAALPLGRSLRWLRA